MESSSLKFGWDRFLKVQQSLPNVGKDGRGNYGSYMKLEDLNPALLKVLNDNGFVWVTAPCVQDGKKCLGYDIVDTQSGAKIGGVMELVMAADSPQAQGSAITYARRYALTAVTGLVADMDDDGQTATDVQEEKAVQDRMKTSPTAMAGFMSTLKSKGVESKEDAVKILELTDPLWQKLNTAGITRMQKALDNLNPDTIELLLTGEVL